MKSAQELLVEGTEVAMNALKGEIEHICKRCEDAAVSAIANNRAEVSVMLYEYPSKLLTNMVFKELIEAGFINIEITTVADAENCDNNLFLCFKFPGL